MTIITCPIHSSLDLHPCFLLIINTPQFQRLRYLRQLGATVYVYPSATHTRFEHSIGVAHLATKLVKSIKEKQPELNITEKDILCIGIAGLCHDLGHGPFSHLFDNEFIMDELWSHEEGSIKMFHRLLDSNHINLKDSFGIDDNDMHFIEELILGTTFTSIVENRKGRPPNKYFLYDIINNERSGFDMDKFDYIIRDSYYTGVHVSIGINFDTITHVAKVLYDENGIQTISFPEKIVYTIFDVFHARFLLHNIVYQNSVVKACEYMIRDILRLADPFIKFQSSRTNKMMTMSESIQDMSVYEQLKDTVLDIIEYSHDQRLQPAKNLLLRLKTRKLYTCCGQIELPYIIHNQRCKHELEYSIGNDLLEISNSIDLNFKRDDFIVEIMSIHHGKGSHNPMDGIRFYNKDSTTTCFSLSTIKYGGGILPTKMLTNCIRIFCKLADKESDITIAFRHWTRTKFSLSPIVVTE